MTAFRRFISCSSVLLVSLTYSEELVVLGASPGTKQFLWESQSKQAERVKKLKKEQFDDELKFIKKHKDKGSPETTLKLDSIRIPLDGKVTPSVPTCDAKLAQSECFDLYYFTGEHYDKSAAGRKNILYISGGPGRTETFIERALGRLEKDYNIVYFHLRGAGLSVVPPSNRNDKYLRNENAVEDIERLRLKILQTTPGRGKPWDAIYGYSFGTVLAQRYANRYPNNVSRLILHAPVYRNKDTDRARKEQLRSNLRNIYSLVRSKESVGCSCRVIDLKSMKIKAGVGISATDNFCFLDANPATNVIDNIVETILQEYDKVIGEYGAMSLIIENFARFKQIYRPPYPDEFYSALRKLDMLGAPQNAESSLSSGTIESMVDAAIVLGYYASLDGTKLLEERKRGFKTCSVIGTIFENAPEESCKKSAYCKRLNDAKKQLRKERQSQPRSEPPRALYVFGVSDGLHQWVPRVLRQDELQLRNESCPSGENLIQFAQSNRAKHRLLREIVRQIGIIADHEYCLWDPKDFTHDVPSLIVTGGADLVTAGCQAEDFFDNGLKGQRSFIEFPVWGHLFEMPPVILRKFLMEPTQAGFRRVIKDDLTEVGANDRTPEDGGLFKCDVR